MARKREVSPAPTLSPRKTRSGAVQKPAEQPPNKKAKVVVKQAKGKGKAKKASGDAAPTEEAAAVPDGVAAAGDADAGKGSASSKTVIIEACKQCQSFNKTALNVKDGLEKQMSEVTVIINPEKPRRGYFEVRDASGEIFVSLPEMKRPFRPMKDLDLLGLVQGITKKLG